MNCKKTHIVRAMTLALTAALVSGCIEPPPVPDMRGAFHISGSRSATLPFTFDDNRVFVEIAFTKSDGTQRKALAFINMGAGSFVLSNKLYRELDAGNGRPLAMTFGAMKIAIDSRVVQPESQANSFAIKLNPFSKPQTSEDAAKSVGGDMAQLAAPMNVEAEIPPGLLENFETVFDYGTKTMTLAEPGSLKPDGNAAPMRVNSQTGFATVDLVVNGERHATVIDNGGSYSIFRPSVLAAWISVNPTWKRADTTLGESNYIMGGMDANVPVAKLAPVRIGMMPVAELGATTMQDGMLAHLIQNAFWNWYSDKAGEPVDGWLAGNLLKSYRVTLDYAHGMTYWHAETPVDTHDLDQVGLTLQRTGIKTTIAAIAKIKGVDAVGNVQVGDSLIEIDGRHTDTMTRGALLSALHGAPGDVKHLILERDGKRISADAPVVQF